MPLNYSMDGILNFGGGKQALKNKKRVVGPWIPQIIYSTCSKWCISFHSLVVILKSWALNKSFGPLIASS